MRTYNPNIGWSVHTVEITYMQWDYSATEVVAISGNCKGSSILQSAIEQHADDLYEEHGDAVEIILKRPALDGSGEDELTCNPDAQGDNAIETWLHEMCVGLKIIDVVPEPENSLADTHTATGANQ